MKLLNRFSALLLFVLVMLLSIGIVPAIASPGNPVPIKVGNYVRWFDRLDLSDAIDKYGNNYAEALYKALEEGIEPSSTCPFLIDPSLAPKHAEHGTVYNYLLITSFTKSTKETQ